MSTKDGITQHATMICSSSFLKNGGPGVRFECLDRLGQNAPGFVIRHQGEVRGYINRCMHLSLELDFVPGRFFDRLRDHLICSTHGALYNPIDGRCVSGPCGGKALESVPVLEENGKVYWLSSVARSKKRQSTP